MSDHSSQSKEMLLVSMLGVLLGGAGTALFMSKEGEKLSENIEGAYHKVKKNIDEILHSLEEKLKERQDESLDEGFDEKSEKWSESIIQTIAEVKKQMLSVDMFKPKDIGMVILLFTLLGAVLGVGATLMIQDKKSEEEDVFHGIASRISSARPLLSELRSQLNECLRPSSTEQIDRQKGGVTNDLLDFALIGLKLWEHVKHRNQ